MVSVMPDHEELKDLLEFPLSSLAKYFKVGDHVRVLSGRFKGETGMVVKIQANIAVLFTDNNNKEAKVLVHDLQLCSEVATGILRLGQYELRDVVYLNNQTGSRAVGLVVRVEHDGFRVLTNGGEVLKVPMEQMGRKRTRRQDIAFDSQQRPLYQGDSVKIISGESKNKTGTVVHLFKFHAFLHSRDHLENQGFLVVPTRSLVAVGDRANQRKTQQGMPIGNTTPSRIAPMSPGQALVQAQGGYQAYRTMPRGRGRQTDELLHKPVRVTNGVYKGLIGMVVDTTDKTARVELHTTCKTITVNKNQLTTSVTPASAGWRSTDGGGRGGMDGPYAPGTPMRPNTPMRPMTPSHAPGTPGHDWDPSARPATPGRDWDVSARPGTPGRDWDPSSHGSAGGQAHHMVGTPGLPGTPGGPSTPYGAMGTPAQNTFGYEGQTPMQATTPGGVSSALPYTPHVPSTPGSGYQPSTPGSGYQPGTPGSVYQPGTPGSVYQQPATPGGGYPAATPVGGYQPGTPGSGYQPTPGYQASTPGLGAYQQPATPGGGYVPATPGDQGYMAGGGYQPSTPQGQGALPMGNPSTPSTSAYDWRQAGGAGGGMMMAPTPAPPSSGYDTPHTGMGAVATPGGVPPTPMGGGAGGPGTPYQGMAPPPPGDVTSSAAAAHAGAHPLLPANWPAPQLEVEIVQGPHAGERAVVLSASGTLPIQLRLDSSGADVSVDSSQHLKPRMPTQKKQQVLILQGEWAGMSGVLVGIDNQVDNVGIVKVQETRDITMLKLGVLCVMRA
mmetsp:Transcript_40835/g.102798  ORF Transcript_40835/g.102798 Transcript_40835/m.102798 type:complete len:780 (-) Transcript_40835:158-2497(-)